MATGYEARQPTRNSFVLDEAAPLRTSTGSSGQSRGASLQGGQSSGGVVTAGLETNPGQIASGLGQYFEKMMEPQIERAKMAKFYEGYTRAQSGEALNELTTNDSPLTKIFGPSGFEEGAQFYHAQAKIGQFSQDILADEDQLKRMPPQELAKVFATKGQEMMTGDPYADAIIQKGLLEAQAPIVKHMTQARLKWQQEDAVAQTSMALDSEAGLLQSLAVKQLGSGEAADQSQVVQDQTRRFAGLLQKPEGMLDDTYRKFMGDWTKRQMEAGNFFAVEIIKDAGLFNILEEDDKLKVEEAYTKFGKRSMSKAIQDPAILYELSKIDFDIKNEKISAADAIDRFEVVNEKIYNMTGVREPYFDGEDLLESAKGVNGILIAKKRREDDRAFQTSERLARQEFDEAQQEAEEDALRVAASAAVASGNVGDFLLSGAGTADDLNVLYRQQWANNDMSGIVQAYKTEAYVSQNIASMIEGDTMATLGDKYSDHTERAYNNWKQMQKVNPAMAFGYYGKLNKNFATFDRMVSSGTMSKQEAYVAAFSQIAGTAPTRAPGSYVETHGDKFTEAIKGQSGYFGTLFGGRPKLSEKSIKVLGPALAGSVFEIDPDGNSTDMEKAAASVLKQKLGNGEIEWYGKVAWQNARRATPLGTLLKVKQGDADAVIETLIDKRLKGAGYADGADGDIRVTRIGNALTVAADGDDGTIRVNITLDDMKFVADARMKAKMNNTPPIDKTKYKGVDPYRIVPGESGAARIVRINREVAGGADPVKR